MITPLEHYVITTCLPGHLDLAGGGIARAPEAGRAVGLERPAKCGHGVVIYGKTAVHTLCHFASPTPASGEVAEGEIVGVSGRSGNATGVHVHWEVAGDWRAVWTAAGLAHLVPVAEANAAARPFVAPFLTLLPRAAGWLWEGASHG